MSNIINSGSYATFDDYDIFPYRCVKYLMNNDEIIWRLLKYNTPNAWDENDPSIPNLTMAEKGALIYNGSDNTANFRVFLDRGQPDTNTFTDCQIRIANYSIFPDNRVVGTLSIILEVYPHYKINHLSNYKTRGDVIMKRLLQVFNGATIPKDDSDGGGTIGKLYFDRQASESNRLEQGGQLPYLGKWAILSTKSS